MLTSIHISNLIIVAELELEFAPGMTALTGETGAGKSILIDALGLALGDKADNSLIRQGAERAEISVSFDLDDCPEAAQWLADNDLDPSDGQCIIRRVLTRDKRSRAYINGVASPGPQLQTLGSLLLAIHGQHAHQALMQASQQRNLLDDYAGLSEPRRQIQQTFRDWQQTRERFEQLRQASSARNERLDLLRFQVRELDQLALGPAELEQLDAEHDRLSHAGRLLQGCSGLLDLLAEGDTDLRSGLAQALRELQELSRLDAELSDPSLALDSALIQLDEAISGLRHYLDHLGLDPERLAELEQRLGSIHDIARKHRLQPAEIPAHHAQLQQELAQLEHADETLDDLLEQTQHLQQAFLRQAEELRQARRQAGARLAREVSESMQQLGMNGGRFAVELEELSLDRASASGLDRVIFMVSANPGQPLQPLAKSASGGELSRISLSLQVATADCSRIPTLIFDEVDVGIGGGVAEIVGRLLRRLGHERQVMCVTHLAQVASQAHNHLQVSKQTLEQETQTRIQVLDQAGRVQEIARMLGGVEITQSTLAHAQEMLRSGTEG
ncbi:MAG: DNA repair protein RecN [Gammaproteobacteria bacterium]|nr:DNA repair protein RecN [Gammaproteobacteria bacterium]